MQSIKRSIMLLKDTDGRYDRQGCGGVLRLHSGQSGTSLSLSANGLERGVYSLYFFLKDGKERLAGNFSGGSFDTSVSGVRLENIAAAAVVRSESGAHSFCLKSPGADWDSIAERFRISRSRQPRQSIQSSSAAQKDVTPDKHVLEPDEDIPNIESKIDTDESETEKTTIPAEEFPLPEVTEKQSACSACPHVMRRTSINPFPYIFPNSEWVKITYPGPAGWWHYISGKIYKGSTVTASVLGVPGEYGMAPPKWLEGFGTYLRCVTGDAKGYWLMFQDAETGEVQDMGLSPHGG